MTINHFCSHLHAIGKPVTFSSQAEARHQLSVYDACRAEIGVPLFRATAGIDPSALESDPSALAAAWMRFEWMMAPIFSALPSNCETVVSAPCGVCVE